MHRCYVCGIEVADAPWGEDGHSPTYEICLCCGCEFGYHDASTKGIEAHRARWIMAGAQWREPKFKPQEWDLDVQIKNLPLELPAGILKNG